MAVDKTFLSSAHKPIAPSGQFDRRWYARLERIVKDLQELEAGQDLTAIEASVAALGTRVTTLETLTTGLPSETTYIVPTGNYTVSHLYRRQYLLNGGNRTITAPTTDCSVDLLIFPLTVAPGPGNISFSGFLTAGTGDAITYVSFTEVYLVRIVRISGPVDSWSTYNVRRVST